MQAAENKRYDLEDRTAKFSLQTRDFCVKLKKDIINIEYIKQLVRSAGSIAANYLEANENLGEKDLKMRIKISRKGSKECQLWLKHVLIYEVESLEVERKILLQEALELEKIFGAILRKLN